MTDKKISFSGSAVFTKFIVMIMMIMWGEGEMWGGSYAKVSVSINPTGSGSVYYKTSEGGSYTKVDDGKDTGSKESETFYFKAEPEENYKFIKWEFSKSNSGSISPTSSTDSEVKITVECALMDTYEYSAKAYFATYYAKVSASATNGTVTVGGNTEQTQNIATSGGNVNFSISATPADGYAFGGWSNEKGSISDQSTSNPFGENTATYAVAASSEDNGTAEYTISANFVPRWFYNIKVQAIISGGGDGGGKVFIGTSSGTPSESSMTVSENTQYGSSAPSAATLYVNAAADTGYEFVGWSESSVATEGDKNITSYSVDYTSGVMPDNPTKTYYAVFKQLPTFYFKAEAKVVDNVGGTAAPDPQTASQQAATLAQESVTKEGFTYTATPAEKYSFIGWGETESGPFNIIKNPYTIPITSTSKEQDNPTTKTLWAKFATYTASINVQATNGTVTCETSQTQNTATSGGSLTFSISATPTSSDYYFTGWTATPNTGVTFANANSQSTTISVPASTEPNGTASYTVTANYAHKPVFFFKANAVVEPSGAGTVAYNTGVLSIMGAGGESQMTMTTQFTATSSDEDIYTFNGWSKTSDGTIENTDNTANLELTSNSLTESSPITTTWYAIFTKAAEPEGMTVSPSSLTLKQKQTYLLSVAFTPDNCYKNVSYTSSNTAVATVDASGKVRGKSKGNATITATALQTDKKTVAATATVSVTVTDEVSSCIGLAFTEGTTPGSLSCFDDFSISEMDLTVSNCLIMPGRHDGTRKDPDGNVIVDFKGTLLEGGKTVKLQGNQQLDCETFYFDTFDQTALDDGTLWAYTFTGWHITNTNASSSIAAIANGKCVPGQTVFQPGDVITPEILREYGLLDSDGSIIAGATLNFEALWGKVWFMMDGRQGTGAKSNTGNDYTKPNNSTTTIMGNSENTGGKIPATSDAYQSVVMLSGDYGHGDGAITPTTGCAFTYKSLQRADGTMKDGTRYVVFFTGSTQMSNYASFRLDNVKGTYRYYSEYHYGDENNNGGDKTFRALKGDYIEATARFSGNMGQIVRIEPDNIKGFVTVLNGGTITCSEVFGYQTESDFTENPRYFYFGRNHHFLTNFDIGPSSGKGSSSGDVYVTVTGGNIYAFCGTSSVGSTNTGNRCFYVYGNQSGSTEYDPEIGMFTAAASAPLDGNAIVTVNGCTNLKDVYGGGDAYTATVNNVSLNISNSSLKGSVYGGGRYGSTAGKASVHISSSTVAGNVYGSGMGSTSSIKTSETDVAKVYQTLTFPTVGPLDGFPNYYSTEATYDDTTIPAGSVMAYRLEAAGVWGGDPYSDNINRRRYSFFFMLSTATANSTEITIDGKSNIGGNVYGGGAIAKVTDGSAVTITGGSTINGSVYGGGDGITTPPAVRICTPLESLVEQPSPDEARAKNIADPNESTDYQRKNPFEDDDYGVDCEWSGDASLLNLTTYPGIDLENKKVYSPNTTGWGDVLGKTQVSVTGGSTVYGDVYGGGNSGKVGSDTSATVETLIQDSEVKGYVFGGCNNAEMSASTDVRVLGSSTIGKNVYGGGNQGEVTGKTYVQIGEE